MRPRLLVVDDLPDSAELLAKLLEKYLPNSSVSICLSGQEALRLSEQQLPDVILMDAKMPGIDGFQACRAIKANPLTRHIPVLMVSGILVGSEHRVSGLECGADGYVCKPFETEELVAQVKALLRVKSNEDALREHEKHLEQELASRTQRLRESEHRFRTLFEQSPDAVFVEDADGVVLDVNPTACRLHGMTREELLGRNVVDLVPSYDRERVAEFFPKWFTGELKDFEGFSVTTTGEQVPVEIRARRVEYGGRPAVILHVRDVAERRRADEALRASETRYRAIVDDQTDMITRWLPGGQFTFVNEAARRFMGQVSKENLMDLNFYPMMDEVEREELRRQIAGLTPERPTSSRESTVILPDGRRRLTQWVNRGIFDQQGRLVEIQSVGRDITETRASERRQRAMTQGLRSVVEMADELLACSDEDSLFRLAVELVRERIGLERCGILIERDGRICGTFGTNLAGETTDERAMVIPWDDVWRERFRLRRPGESPWLVGEAPLFSWSGGAMEQLDRRGWLVTTPIQTHDQPIGVFCNDSAISGAQLDETKQEILAVFCALLGNLAARRRAEAQMTQLAMAVDQSADVVVITDIQARIRYVNRAFERITGFTRDEALGRNPRILSSGRQDKDFYRRMWQQLIEGANWTGHMLNKRKDGTLYEVDTTISPVRDGSGKLIGYLALSQDVTRAMQMEAELRQSQKMEGIGRLAGGVAHDFNNLLTAILGYARLVLDELPGDSPLRGDVEEIIRAGDRAARLTKQLLAFGRKQLVQIHPLDLNRVVLNMDQILRRTLGEDIEMVTMVSDDLGSVEGDAGLIEQIIMNLAVNARDAMPRGGKLTVITDRVELDEAYCQGLPGLHPGEYVMLLVRDTGCGMTDEVREHAFEPFFTTKEKGKGSGLGLSTVYGIVNQLRGHIELLSEVGKGTEFRIYLPRIQAAAQDTPPRSSKPVSTGTETILVVEDENTVRYLAVRFLESLGYSALQARNGEEALRLFQRSEKKVDLVLTDVVMPTMGGPELAEHLRGLQKDLRVVFMTGFADELPDEQARGARGVPLVLKPFTREILGQTVREALDADRTSGSADRRGY